jgi:hypothetical protein
MQLLHWLKKLLGEQYKLNRYPQVNIEVNGSSDEFKNRL